MYYKDSTTCAGLDIEGSLDKVKQTSALELINIDFQKQLQETYSVIYTLEDTLKRLTGSNIPNDRAEKSAEDGYQSHLSRFHQNMNSLSCANGRLNQLIKALTEIV
jgi:hypothetical protein